ncbi:MAG: DUF2142 domain-containing protein [Nocardioidaceae bacterium]|nr:DUF2142 domain-containing protein [Nocardioidaceae bacterium]
MRPEPSARRIFGGTLVGLLLVQAAWILALPAFRGIDEFDHVYKATAVARWQWLDDGPPTEGRGGLVTIPANIVRAARSECQRYNYTEAANCVGTPASDPHQQRIATAASRYNPAYYLIVGTIARPFDGAAADYVMRAVTALLCALLLAWSAALLVRCSGPSWVALIFTIGITPVLVYSTSIASPNGLTYAGAALLWASIAAFTRTYERRGQLALPATIGAVALTATHTTGPMWLALTGVTALVLVPRQQWFTALRTDLRTWTTAGSVVMFAVLLSVVWVRHASTNALGPAQDQGHAAIGELFGLQFLWALQAIAAYPTRNEHPPVFVYALWAVLLLAALMWTARVARPRLRLALGLLLAMLVVVPTTLTVIAYPHQGPVWQGRYSLPLWMGVLVVMLLAIPQVSRPPRRILVHTVVAMTTVAVATSVVWVAHREAGDGLGGNPALGGSPWELVLLALLAIAGCCAPWGLGAFDEDAPRTVQEPETVSWAS